MIGNIPDSRRVTNVGLTMGVSVGLFAYGGLWLDQQFGTKPWLLLVCVIAGIGGSILHLIHVLMPEKWPWPSDAEKAARLAKVELQNAALHKAEAQVSRKQGSQANTTVSGSELDPKPDGTVPDGPQE